MKIPESVRIAGIEFKVEIVPTLMSGAKAAYGHIDYDNSVVDMFAKGIYQVLQDNGARFFDITKGGE